MTKFREAITSSFDEQFSEGRIYKLTHQLKNRGYLLSIKKDILLITNPKNIPTEDEIEDLFYRKLLKQHCQLYCKNNRYIGGLTALELHLHGSNNTLPEDIIVYNQNKQAVETILLNRKVVFKMYETKSKNLYPAFAKQTSTRQTKGGSIRHANIELSILECLYNLHPSNTGYIENLITKAVKKYHKTLQTANFQDILKQKRYNTSANRLQKLIRNSHPELAENLKNLIKKYGHIL